MIDENGFRANVGIIVANSISKLLWAKRVGHDSWQFPQGGVNIGESAEQALWRELYEEVGLHKSDVAFIASTKYWLSYYIPKALIRNSLPRCIGQKQKWFLLRLLSDHKQINFAITSSPEFEDLQWVSYWYPLSQIVAFKRDVYRCALKELAPKLFAYTNYNRKTKLLNNILEYASISKN